MITLRDVFNNKPAIEHTAKCLGLINIRLCLDGLGRLNLVVNRDSNANLNLVDSLTRAGYLQTWIEYKLGCLTQVLLAEATKGTFKAQIIDRAINLNNEEGLIKLFGQPAEKVIFENDEGLSDLTLKYTLPKIEQLIAENSGAAINVINDGVQNLMLRS
jgi:hypothetical protein